MQVDIRAMPKVELHVHLEGTIAASTALELARRHGVDPASLPLVGGAYPSPFTSFQHFVDTYLAVSSLIRDPDDLETIAAAFARSQREQNVLYTEVTFTAGTHVRNGMDPTAMWKAIAAGLAESGPDHEIRLIVDAVRNMGPEDGPSTIKLAELSEAPVAGLGLTGIEGSVPEGEFRVLREAADSSGWGLAVHAGETGTSRNIEAALDDLGADRIGHGVASVTDPALVQRLVSDQTPVEVCPTSNVALGVFATLEDHPFPQMWDAGMNVLVNSDDPPFFSTTLTNDLAQACRLASLGPSDLAELQRRAARAAFAPEATKQRLLDAIEHWASGSASESG